MIKKPKKPKKPKLKPIGKIKRRLLRVWSKTVHQDQQNRCAICGLKTGDIVAGKVQKIDAHHIEDKLNYALRFDRKNGILLCVWHHKFVMDSAHRSPVFFIEWLKRVRPQQLLYVRAHRYDKPNLNNREILAQIEEDLKQPLSEEDRLFFNIADLEDWESKKDLNPMYTPQSAAAKKKANLTGHLFEDLDSEDEEESSSSSGD